MKKILALALAAAMTLSLAACGGGTTTPPAASTPAPGTSTPAPSVEDLNVGVFYYTFSDVYISSVRTNMDAKLNELGVKYQNYDGGNVQPTQLDQVNTAITNGCNLLIVNIVETSSPDAAQQVCDAAKTADIPVIFFNREVADSVVASYDKCAFVGTDAAEAGHMQGAMIAEFLLESYDALDLNGDGTISYVMFKGQEGNAEAEFRTQYAVEDADSILAENGKAALTFYNAGNSAKYLVDQTGAWSAQAATDYMNTILAEYSEANGNMVEMIIANNDNMAEGAVAALQGAGYNMGNDQAGKPTSPVIPVFGVDAVDSAKEKINAGQMTGTIKQDAEGMAATITALVANIQNGGALMDGIDAAGGYNVDVTVDKVRVPYGMYLGE